MGNHKTVRATNVKLLGDGSSRSDHSHVKRVTPLDTKRKQMKTAPDIDKGREKRTTRLRRNKEVKPI